MGKMQLAPRQFTKQIRIKLAGAQKRDIAGQTRLVGSQPLKLGLKTGPAFLQGEMCPQPKPAACRMPAAIKQKDRNKHSLRPDAQVWRLS